MATTNYISQIKDTAGTTHDIQLGVSTRIFRGTCSTAAGQSPKVITLDDDTQYSLTTGVRIAVTFTYGNSITTPSLNVGGTSKTIAFPTAVATRTTGNGTTYNLWGPYETVIFTYDGTYWVHSGSALSIYNAYALADSKTANTGTVTQVTAGTGLSINQTSGGNFTTSGTINHTNSVTAQTTQAIYPIKIDAQGHISAYGTAVTPLTASSTLDATKLSGTIPNGCYSDTKVTQTDLNKTNSIKSVLFSSGTGSTTTDSVYTSSHFKYNDSNSTVYLFNSDSTKSSYWNYNKITFGNSSNNYFTYLLSGSPSSNITLTLPTTTGTLALTSDIPEAVAQIIRW